MVPLALLCFFKDDQAARRLGTLLVDRNAGSGEKYDTDAVGTHQNPKKKVFQNSPIISLSLGDAIKTHTHTHSPGKLPVSQKRETKQMLIKGRKVSNSCDGHICNRNFPKPKVRWVELLP